MCFLKTHYYGGIKKYQWTAIPLALHGVVVLKDGTKVELKVGEDPKDPVFYIDDLLPHLGQEQMAGNAGKIIEGEQLNVVVGGMPYPDEEVGKKIKLTVLHYLNEKYGMCEEDFLSAELSAVPAYPARDVGFDRALIGAYGHDDRVCAYPALTAVLNGETEHTVLAMLVDKEEIGSEGTTGMQCKIYEDLMEEICIAMGASFRKVRFASKCLSSDVTAAYDPNFASVYERMNSAMLSCGTCMSKFTGARGKSGQRRERRVRGRSEKDVRERGRRLADGGAWKSGHRRRRYGRKVSCEPEYRYRRSGCSRHFHARPLGTHFQSRPVQQLHGVPCVHEISNPK